MSELRILVLGALAGTLVWAMGQIPPLAWPWLLALLLIASLLAGFLDLKDGRFHGLADLLIHALLGPKSKTRVHWASRGLVSGILSVVGGPAGIEGSLTEVAHSYSVRSRPISANWFELQRRTDVAACLAAGIGALFGTPFAALVMGIEFKLGGRLLHVVLASLSATLVARWLGVPPLVNYSEVSAVTWGNAQELVLSFVGLSAGVLFFLWSSSAVLKAGFKLPRRFAVIFAASVLVLLYVANAGRTFSFYQPLSDAPWAHLATLWAGFLAILIGFGTTGVFSPLWAIGTILGQGLSLLTGWSLAFTPLFGGVLLVAAGLSLPFTVSTFIYEVTQSPPLFGLSLLASLAIVAMRLKFKVPSLSDVLLQERGVRFEMGRSREILENFPVREVMAREFSSVMESDTLEEVLSKIAQTPNPFIVVLNRKGGFSGLLTTDRITRAYQRHGSKREIGQLLEAKDLLYRVGLRIPTVKEEDPLSVTEGKFDQSPVLPVVGPDERVTGLIYAHDVRIFYDREMARKSMVYLP